MQSINRDGVVRLTLKKVFFQLFSQHPFCCKTMNNEELLEPTPPPQVDQGDTNDPLPQRLASLDIFDPGPQPPLEYVDDIFLSPSFSTSIEDPDNSFSTDWPQNNNLQFYQFPFQQYIPMYQPPSLDTQQHTPTPFSLSAEHAFDKCPFINTYLQRQRMESDNTLMPLADVSLDRLIELDSLLPLTPLQGIVDNKTFVQVAELPHYRPDNLQFPQPGSFYPQTPQDSESSTLIEEEQRLWDIIFSPMSPQIPQRVR
ncbi:hypothetical protein EDD21DRAFT_172774 [Dissophora ornata]|nr:hypothetical protein EDD21DRAFT_172774 [Dissophora ornata]